MAKREIQQYYIECLKQDLAKRVGRSIDTYSDFNYLFMMIKKSQSDVPSVSTLKRLWSYVANSSTRSRTTLNSLARFLGFFDWTAYVESLMRDNRVESGFIDTKSVLTANLLPDDVVLLEWNPDRVIRARYIGDNVFEVEENKNSKLPAGARFSTPLITRGAPLVCSNVIIDGNDVGSYMAGTDNGLTVVEILPMKNP